MLKHVAVLGKSQAALDAVKKAAAGKDLEPVLVKPGEVLPPTTAAVIAGPRQAEAAVTAALTLGARQEELLGILSHAIDCQEDFVPGTSQRVRQYATRFAHALSLSPDERITLERGALVRDIGMLEIPNELLLKDTLLTSDDWFLLRQHPQRGAELLMRGTALRDVCDIVLHHHECFDGTGYPDGLEGEDIPYVARIVKILDVYCAMTSLRRYRKGQSTPEEAIEHLRAESGKRFDPKLVKVFVEAKIGMPDPRSDGGRSS